MSPQSNPQPLDDMTIPGYLELPDMRCAEEDWTGTTAQTKRRKLQNRLNQRARRRRLQQDKQAAQQPSLASTASSLPGDTAMIRQDEPKPTVSAPANSAPKCELGVARTQELLEKFAEQAAQCYQFGTPNLSHLADTVRCNVFLALARNNQILGFDRAWLSYDAISPFHKPGPRSASDLDNCPPTMRPTKLQVLVEHHPWIDLFPCPRMRDNFLGLIHRLGEDAVDEDALCHDFVDAGHGPGNTAAVIAWTDPWSPLGWEVTEEFLRKWGWILHGCIELQEGTNSWRQRRGLSRLQFPGC